MITRNFTNEELMIICELVSNSKPFWFNIFFGWRGTCGNVYTYTFSKRDWEMIDNSYGYLKALIEKRLIDNEREEY